MSVREKWWVQDHTAEVAITPVSDNSQAKSKCWAYNCVSPVSSSVRTATGFGPWIYTEPLVAQSTSTPDAVNIDTAGFCIKFTASSFCFFTTLRCVFEDSSHNFRKPEHSQPARAAEQISGLVFCGCVLANAQPRHWGQVISSVAQTEIPAAVAGKNRRKIRDVA